MKVSELAERAGTSAKTIRFYETAGILPAPARTDNGYREYADDDVCRVRLVVALRYLGLDLTESGRLAELCSTGRCDQMEADLASRVSERRAAVATAIAELSHLDAELAVVEQALASEGGQLSLCSDQPIKIEARPRRAAK